jgi:segregation and condensation protein A
MADEPSQTALPPVAIPAFAGPLDLLLHLIRVNEVEITDIPIAEITEQYTAYLDAMQELDLDVASEYIALAAELIYIKSRMLLPRVPGAPEEDPRAELAQRLLEYEKFKRSAETLHAIDTLRGGLWPRPETEVPRAEGTEETLEVSLFDLSRPSGRSPRTTAWRTRRRSPSIICASRSGTRCSSCSPGSTSTGRCPFSSSSARCATGRGRDGVSRLSRAHSPRRRPGLQTRAFAESTRPARTSFHAGPDRDATASDRDRAPPPTGRAETAGNLIERILPAGAFFFLAAPVREGPRRPAGGRAEPSGALERLSSRTEGEGVRGEVAAAGS